MPNSSLRVNSPAHNSFMLFLVLALTLLAGSCGKHKEPPLRLLLWSSERGNEAIQHRLQEFSQINPGISVDLTVCTTPEECLEKFLSESRQVPPDVCMIEGKNLPLLSGNLRDLGSFKPDLHAFSPQITSLLSFQGKTLAIPLGWSTQVLYYNRQLFDRHGIPYPNASWEWGDLLHAAEAMTVMDDHSPSQEDSAPNKKIIQYGLDIGPSPENWLPFIWQNHGQLIREDGSWSLTDPQFIQSNLQAIGFYASLVREHHVAPLPGVLSKASLGTLFLNQKAPLTIAHRDLASRLRNIKPGFDWDIAPLPKKGEPATCLETVGFAMSSKTKKPDDAWKLISFLLTETSQETFILNGSLAPAASSLLNSKVFLDFPGPQAVHNSVLCDSLSFAKSLPHIAYWNEASAILTEEMAVLMSDSRMSARSTLERMQARLDELQILNQLKK